MDCHCAPTCRSLIAATRLHADESILNDIDSANTIASTNDIEILEELEWLIFHGSVGLIGHLPSKHEVDIQGVSSLLDVHSFVSYG